MTAPEALIEDLRENWTAISARLTASYSRRKKSELHGELSALAEAIEKEILAEAGSGNDDVANRWRYVEFLVSSVVAELAMWISISKERVVDAWNEFVAAEGLARLAARWLSEETLVTDRVVHLIDVERVAFPHIELFTSVGVVVSDETCSICNSPYGTCCHLAGEVYAGTFARRIANKIVAPDHVAIVKEPRDKACRFMNVGGLDPLTGEPPPNSILKRSPLAKRSAAPQKRTRRKRKKRRQ